MTRWLLAAKTARPPSDKIDANDKNGPDGFKSILSIKSEEGKHLFQGVLQSSQAIASGMEWLGPEVDDQWMRFEERAAILEFDAGYSREEAERLARAEVYGLPN